MPKQVKSDKRLIEHYLPIEAISAEARREKSVRKGHISTLHLWWARRPLVAARAAVFGALVPQDAATPEFVADLCKYPGASDTIKQAQQLILQAHADRLSAERGEKITVEDIEAGRAPRPKVLDMFAGGGAIPLEALRLGCESYALDLNPVAHLIQLCTLVYPQKYGKPDPTAKGSAPDGTWAGLAKEVEHWGKWVLDRVKEEIGDLYPPIPDPRETKSHTVNSKSKDKQLSLSSDLAPDDRHANMLTPVAYLWTRTVRCKNPSCGAIVPLARQTWLAKKSGRFVALKLMIEETPTSGKKTKASASEKRVHYRVVESKTEKGLGFDPEAGSKGGNVACPFCGTVEDVVHIKSEGKSGRLEIQLMSIVCTQRGDGKVYFSPTLNSNYLPDEISVQQRLEILYKETGLTAPDESLPPAGSLGFRVQPYGLSRWADLFSHRQLLSILTFTKQTRIAYNEILRNNYSKDHAKALTTYLGLLASRTTDWNSNLTHWTSQGEKLGPTFTRMALPMVWDFVEINSLAKVSGNAVEALERMVEAIRSFEMVGNLSANANRGSATSLPFEDGIFDAIITDPPYYDNVPYSDLSDFFYVWLKRSIGHLYPEHFSSVVTPKKQEAIMDAGRHQRNKNAAKEFYEQTMAQSFVQANSKLKSNAPLVIVYAHKTTLGWSTLVDALRIARFTVTEAWPLDTERPGRPRANDSAALASSIFLVARRRENDETGSYEEVKPELEAIVRERVETLWKQGITGADLVIACVGAGLRAFTRFARVEYANGEEVPADKFLSEVEGVVLETLLEKLFGVARSGVSAVDAATRFYVLWRYAYRAAAIAAGEAIIFALPQGVELDGAHSLSAGPRPLVEKLKSQYRLCDFTERGDDEKLGLPTEGGSPAPLIDSLHRILYLMENDPASLGAFLDESKANVEQLHLVAQTLAGSALAGNGSGGGKSLVAARGAEAAALRVLTTNWRTLIESKRGTLV